MDMPAAVIATATAASRSPQPPPLVHRRCRLSSAAAITSARPPAYFNLVDCCVIYTAL